MTSISYSKIILSVGMIVFVAAMVVAGTGAFFSDTETSTGNVFAAGAIDLQIDNESYAIDHNIPGYEDPTGAFVANPNNSWELTDLTIEKFFDFVDLKPGDYGEDTISIHVDDNDAYVCAAANITGDFDNDITEPEDEEFGSNSDNDDGTPDGDLDSELNFAFWADDGDNVLEVDEVDSIFINGSLDGIGLLGPIALADSDESVFADAGPVPGDETVYIAKAWCFGTLTADAVAQDDEGKTGSNGPLDRGTGVSCDGSGATNLAQTDSVEGDLEFYAVQSRNNENFQCSDWDPGFEGQRPSVGAVLGAYAEPDPLTCNILVDPDAVEDATTFNTLTGAEAAAADGDVICVDTGDYVEDVTVDVANLTILGLNDPKGVDAATVEGRMDIDSDGVTVSGLAFTNPDAGYGIVIDGSNETEISFNSFANIGTTILGSAQAIYYDGNPGDADGLVITNNMIDTVGHDGLEPGGSGTSAKGIFIGDSTSPDSLTGVVIEDNMISNIVASSDAFGDGGRGAYGILINYGVGSTGDVPGAIVRNNTIETLAGWWVHAVGLETDTSAAVVTYNAISDLSGAGGDSSGVFFEGNPNSNVAVNYNNLAPGVLPGVGIHPTNPAISVDAENNWWGDLDPSDNVLENAGTIDFDPFEAAAFPLN